MSLLSAQGAGDFVGEGEGQAKTSGERERKQNRPKVERKRTCVKESQEGFFSHESLLDGG